MDVTEILAIILGLGMFGGLVYLGIFLYLGDKRAQQRMTEFRQGHGENINNDENDTNESRGGALDRMRRRINAGQTADVQNIPMKKIGKKKMEKLERKKERQENNRLMLEMREERKRQEAEEEEERKKKEQKEALVHEEEEQKRLEKLAEIEAKEQEEYEKWRTMMSVEDVGSVEEQVAQESQGLLAEFIEYIRRRKIVVLTDLASHFELKSQDVVQRLKSLDEMGMISGIIDDRGKFIYISKEEMKGVADFIRKRGRVSLEELTAESDRLVTLEGSIEPLT